MRSGTALVLGAGIQGCCSAIALARQGWDVTIVDRLAQPLTGASLRGEGKLHLGYVYGNDPSGRTAELMVDAALTFGPLLQSWLPTPPDWTRLTSHPFLYGVLPGTLRSPDQLAGHYERVDRLVAERLASGGSYVGRTTLTPAHRLGDHHHRGFASEVTAAFETDEIAIDPAGLRAVLLRALGQLGVTVVGSTQVRSVERRAGSLAVTVGRDATAGGSRRMHADIAVNCLWQGRLGIDATLGIEPPRPWTYRLKYGVQARVRPGRRPPPSVTFVLGPFGDIVHRPGGEVYLSWYPECVAGRSSEIEVPHRWDPILRAEESPTARHDVATATVRALRTFVPGLDGVEVVSAAAGVIVAWGDTDIDDDASELHQRHAVGVHEHDGYFSIDTGKLTCAPMFAHDLVARLGRVAA